MRLKLATLMPFFTLLGTFMHVLTRLFKEPEQSFFLFGARGTGKSTSMKLAHPNALWINLLKPEVLRRYLARPEELRSLIEGDPSNKVVVIDEVQRAPSLLSIVHEIIEEKKGYQFILTGSSARKLKRTSADLLGGRALNKTLHPFMAAELGAAFSLEHALEYGLLPLLFEKSNPGEILQAYISIYLQEEIQAEGLVRNLESFARFLEIIAFSHATQLNVTNVARESEVKRKTVENYLDILYELLLAFQLTNFTRRAQRELSTHPKFYLFDAGVFKTLRRQGPLERPEEIAGAALEGLVAQHLRAWNDYSNVKHSLHFWRTRSGTEVDFIIYGPQGLFAIEVKNSKQVYPKDVKPLEIFLEDYPMAKAIILYRGTERLRIKNVLCVPVAEFLKALVPNAQPPFLDY